MRSLSLLLTIPLLLAACDSTSRSVMDMRSGTMTTTTQAAPVVQKAAPAVERPVSPGPVAQAGVAVSGTAMLEQMAATSNFRLGQPKNLTVTPQGDAVLFLRSTGPRSFVQDLWLFDVATGTERVLLTAEQVLEGKAENLTPEELARRERARSASRGIAGFALADDGNELLVPLSGRLFVIDITSRAAPKVKELKSEAGYPIDPRFSPDGKRVVCVRGGDLYVIDVATGKETRLTTGATESVTHGLAEFVAQEEMDRSQGYWFSPDSAYIVYQRTDTSGLETFTIADAANPGKPAQTWPYPRAGKANAEVTLGVMPLTGGATTWITWDRAKYPYLARVDWSKKAPLTLLVQNREQTEQLLLRADPAGGTTSTILRETDAAWLNLNGGPVWLPDGSGFLWATEQDAMPPNDRARIELRSADGALLAKITDGSFNASIVGFDRGEGGEGSTGVVLSRSVDFNSNQLWLHPIRSRQAPVPLTSSTPLHSHSAVLSEKSGTWVHGESMPDGTSTLTVRAGLSEGAPSKGVIKSIAETPVLMPRPEFTTVTVGGVEIAAAIVRPSGFDPKKKYPVLNSVYGGPHSNMVTNSMRAYVQRQWMAEQGFIVVSLDARGTPGKGRAWERVIKGNVIDTPLAEQTGGMMALCAKYPEMDASRMGVYGWSFGGYFTVLAAERRPDVFKAGVAVAPVADWRDYDTHYTERYMGLPDANKAGYDASSALTYAKDLKVPLLIMHGTADDNVYTVNSLRLTDALFRAGRPFEFVPLSGFTHAVNEPAALAKLWERAAGHFVRYLGGPR